MKPKILSILSLLVCTLYLFSQPSFQHARFLPPDGEIGGYFGSGSLPLDDKFFNGENGFIKKLNSLDSEDFDNFFDDLSDVEDMEVWAKTFGRSSDNLDMYKALKGRPHWVRMNADLHVRLNEFKLPQGSITTKAELLDKVNDLYNPQKFQKPAGCIPPAICNGVYFDKFGFPDFSSHYPNIAKKKYYSENLVGNELDSPDFEKAAEWFVKNNPGVKLANHKKGITVDGKYYTMHHMEDGNTVIPVLQSTHIVSHTGGNAMIERDLQGLFEIQ
ncbi:MAG: hypothetical protein IPH57_08725 [Saprospiraceae bacterium]|nr:hypothetical protein [Saprospiraceae bacterium]